MRKNLFYFYPKKILPLFITKLLKVFFSPHKHLLGKGRGVVEVLIKNKINRFKYSYFLPFILSKVDSSILNSDISELAYAVFLLSVITLYCLTNILLYFTSIIIIQQKNYELKYPKLKTVINYYKKFSIVYISIEIFFCVVCLLMLIISSLIFMYIGLK